MNLLHQISGAVLLFFTLELSQTTVLAQNTVFTYQGQVTVNGTNFSGLGQFQFALVASTNVNQTAVGTANAPNVNGYIIGYTVTFGGSGYVTPPAVTVVGGGGTGAAAAANLTGGVVTSISVENSGNGNYTSAPTVVIAPPPINISPITFWSNDGTSVAGGEPSAVVSVPVTNGLFTVALGDATQPGMNVIPAALFTSQPNLQLRIWFNDGKDGFEVLTPAQNLTPTPYAIAAGNVAGGLTVQQNTNGAPNVIGGAQDNYISNGVIGATIGGGGAINDGGSANSNSITANYGTIGGGGDNTLAGTFSTVGGGFGNTASSGGGSDTVSGGYENTVGGGSATISGGYGNIASSVGAVIAGGGDNLASGGYAIICGGNQNTNSGTFCFIGGGYDNMADFYRDTVCGGSYNVASADGSTISGGSGNTASGDDSTIAGGLENDASGSDSTIPGGYGNTASAEASFAAGYNAQALNQYSFVWSDGTSFSSTANNQFAIHANGGALLAANVQIGTSAADYRYLALGGGNSLGYLYGSYPFVNDAINLGYNYYADASGNGHVSNLKGGTSRISARYGEVDIAVGTANTAPNTVRLVANTTGVTVYGTFNNLSDRNAKQDFAPISPAGMLEKIGQLPISEWSYKEDPTTRHVGPVAQDFYSVFNIGTDEKHIAPIDEGGVALAAIQGLNQKVESENAALHIENAELKKQNDLLAGRLDELEAEVRALAQMRH